MRFIIWIICLIAIVLFIINEIQHYQKINYLRKSGYERYIADVRNFAGHEVEYYAWKKDDKIIYEYQLDDMSFRHLKFEY